MTRYRLDASTHILGDGNIGDETTVVGGSPSRLFRLTEAGRTWFDRIAAGDDIGANPLADRLLVAGAIHPVVDPGGAHRYGPDDVTVVIPTHNDDPEQLQRMLEACSAAARVVFVDDCSTPPVTGMRGASVIRLRHNSGPGAARNAGYRSVQTPLVAFVDSDVTLPDGWLEGLLGHFDDDLVGLVAPRVASGPADPGANAGVARYEVHHSPLDLGTEPARIEPGTRVSYAPAATLVMRVDALNAIDGFDAELRVGEDVDAVWRLVAAGWRARYEPTVVVTHAPRSTWQALAAQRMFYGESAASLADRHGDAVAPLRTNPWTLGVWSLAATGRPISAAVLLLGTSVALVPKLKGVRPIDSVRMAIQGHVAAGGSLAAAIRRTWFPIVALASLPSRRARLITAAAIGQGLARGGPARVLDDAAYSVGVWKGIIARRQLRPLVPVFSRWPPRDRPDSPSPSSS